MDGTWHTYQNGVQEKFQANARHRREHETAEMAVAPRSVDLLICCTLPLLPLASRSILSSV